MGLELDSTIMEARLPDDKLKKLRSLLTRYSVCRKIRLKELQSLLGLLNFCCSVVLPGRTFLHRLTDLTCKVHKPHHRITLNRESRQNIKAWQIFLEHFNGRQLLLEQRWLSNAAIHLFTDAAGALGFAAIYKYQWFYGTWPPQLKPFNITFKELFPIALAFELWGHLFHNHCIILHSDNKAVVHILNKQTSKESKIMKLVRRLVIAAMKYNVLFRSEHIQGKANVLPDLLSHLQVERFKEMAPHMDPNPTEIPHHLLVVS